MPAYDFRCTQCDCVFEITRKTTETGPVPCPECGGDTKRVFSPVGVHFKGSGFHNTDYKRSTKNATKETDGPKSDCAAKSDSSACASCPASGNTPAAS